MSSGAAATKGRVFHWRAFYTEQRLSPCRGGQEPWNANAAVMW